MSKHWMRLDNAALIFPATKKAKWANCFRLSASLCEQVDPVLLQQAVNDLKPRFPSFFVRLRPGLFWYYLEELPAPPAVHRDYAYPLPLMSSREMRQCCLRVLYYNDRIALEFFHALSDGSGGMILLKTLVARYLELAHEIRIPAGDGVLSLQDAPKREELEDSFQLHAAKYPLQETETRAEHFRGSTTPDFLFLTTGILPTPSLVALAHSYHATVTTFLAAVMAQVALEKQAEEIPPSRRRPVNICLPVNLRRLYGSTTLRNFVLPVNPGVDPRLGSYTLEELCESITAQLHAEVTPQRMAGRMAMNVKQQNMLAIRLVPLFLKSFIMRRVYASVGETHGSINVSNLGLQKLPQQMAQYVERMEFIIGVQKTYPNNCSVVSFGEQTCVNMIRNIRESDLERRFFSRLIELGIPVAVESNEAAYRSAP